MLLREDFIERNKTYSTDLYFLRSVALNYILTQTFLMSNNLYIWSDFFLNIN